MLYRKIIIYNLILLVIADALTYLSLTGMFMGNEFFSPVAITAKFWVLFNLIYIASKSDWQVDMSKTVAVLFKLILIWNIIAIIRGIFTANDYWDWKFLFFDSGFFFLIPLAFFIGKSLSLTKAVFYYTINYLFLFGFIAIPISLATNPELYSRLMISVSFFVIFIPYLKPRQKLLILIVAITSALLVPDFRTNTIKIAVSILVLSTWYIRRFVSIRWFKTLHMAMFFVPLALLFLAVSGQYNVFSRASENDDYVVKASKNKNGEDENMMADTRTFIYVEVFKTLSDGDSWLTGKGAVGKYKTDSFDNLVEGDERYGSEVGFVNMLLYSGIIGVVIYGLFLLVISRNAIYYSNNWLCKMLGLVIMSRWIMLFFEEYTQFDLNFYFLWIIIGLISSKQFRSMSDAQIEKIFTRL